MRKAIVSTLVALATVPVFAGSSWAATAAPVPLAQPVQVVLSGPSATLSARVATVPPTAPVWSTGHCVAVSAPLAGVQRRVGVSCSYSSIVPVKVTMPSRSFVVGRSTWMVRDLRDGALRPLAVDARQASRFAWGAILPVDTGLVYVDARVDHYHAATGAWGPSGLSPVWVQVLKGGSWVTVGSVTTNLDGHAFGLVGVPVGAQVFRLYRPAGATVWGAASATQQLDPGVSWNY
jgi:hypothetical protein